MNEMEGLVAVKENERSWSGEVRGKERSWRGEVRGEEREELEVETKR